MQSNLSRISATIRPDYRRQLKSGEFHLRLFVYQNPRSKKSYPTHIRVTDDEWAKINSETAYPSIRHTKDQVLEILSKARKLTRIFSADFSFDEFEEHMFGVTRKDRYDTTDVYATFRIKIGQLKKENRIGSAKVYETVMDSLRNYRQCLKFHQVTVKFLYRYEQLMLDNGCKRSTVGIRMRHLKAIVNMAKYAGVVTAYDYPFGRRAHNKYEIPSSRCKKKALLHDELMLLKNYRSNEKEEWARDMWLLSFYCNGMNMTDIFNLKWSNVDNDFLYFVREKTKFMCRKEEPVEIFLTDEAKRIIDRWAICSRKHKNDYLFGVFDNQMTGEEKIAANKASLRIINLTMQRIARSLGIKSHITTMVARHTWATVLMHSGVPIPYISKGLGHTSVLTTENYLADFEQQYKRDIGQILSQATANPTAEKNSIADIRIK